MSELRPALQLIGLSPSRRSIFPDTSEQSAPRGAGYQYASHGLLKAEVREADEARLQSILEVISGEDGAILQL